MALCVQNLIPSLATLTSHPNIDMAVTVLQILEAVNVSETSLTVMSQLCHSSVILLVRALACEGDVMPWSKLARSLCDNYCFALSHSMQQFIMCHTYDVQRWLSCFQTGSGSSRCVRAAGSSSRRSYCCHRFRKRLCACCSRQLYKR